MVTLHASIVTFRFMDVRSILIIVPSLMVLITSV